MKNSLNLVRFDMIVFQILIMVYLFLYGMDLTVPVILVMFVVTALNLVYILYELEKIHNMIFKTKSEKESIALLDEEKTKSLDHIKEIKRLFQGDSQEDLLSYIEKSQKEYYDEEVLKYDLEILNIILQRYTHICKTFDIQFDYDIQTNVKALLDAAEFTGEQLCTVLGNLLDNAIDVLKHNSGERHLNLSIAGNGYQVTVEVTNNGDKIPERVMEKIFNYGFSTKEEGRGTGLFIVYKLAEKLGAVLSVQSDQYETSFKMVFELD